MIEEIKKIWRNCSVSPPTGFHLRQQTQILVCHQFMEIQKLANLLSVHAKLTLIQNGVDILLRKALLHACENLVLNINTFLTSIPALFFDGPSSDFSKEKLPCQTVVKTTQDRQHVTLFDRKSTFKIEKVPIKFKKITLKIEKMSVKINKTTKIAKITQDPTKSESQRKYYCSKRQRSR